MSDPDPESGDKPFPRESLLQRLKAFFSSDRDNTLRESLEDVIETHEGQHQHESFRPEAKAMILNLVAFADLRVDDVMVPRADIVALADTASVRTLLDCFIEASHSRLVIYRESLDEIAGMVHVRDLMRWIAENGEVKKARKSAKQPAVTPLSLSAVHLGKQVKQTGLLREVLFVPPSMPATDLLIKMQSRQIHLAIVIDEYGGTDGICSIEDLVEQIVGDIADEHDLIEADLVRDNGDGTFIADARADIEELERLLGVELLPSEREEETYTLGGLAFSLLGRVPVRGERLHHDSGLEFEILDADPRRVKRIKIHTRRAPSPSEPKSSEAG